MLLKFQLDRLTLTPLRFCGKGYRKTDRQAHTHTDGLSKTTFLDVSMVVDGCTSTTQIRPYLKLDFLHDANTSLCDIEVQCSCHLG